MVIFLYGPDTVRLREHLHKLTTRFIEERDPSGMNVTTLDATATTLSEVMGVLLAVPFLASRRMVVVRGVCDAADDIQEWLLERLDRLRMDDDIVILVHEDALGAKNELGKALAKEQYAIAFAAPEGDALHAWIVRRVTALGSEISVDAVVHLATAISDDMVRLGNRVHQLALAADGAMITLEDAIALVPEPAGDVVFALMDAVVKRDHTTALQLLEQQWEYRGDAQQLFGMLVRQFRILADLISYSEMNPNAKETEIAKALALHPYVVKKTRALMRGVTRASVARAVESLLVIDEKIKRGAGHMPELLALFIREQ